MTKGILHHSARHLALVGMVLMLSQCGLQPKDTGRQSEQILPLPPGSLIVDTILYPVTIINPDSLDTWTDLRLKRLNHKALVNDLFEALYNNKIKAYNYYNHQPISTEVIREMETSGELNREEIAQLQFEEAWYFNGETGRLTKNVNSILLALPVFNDQEEVKGYKAVFVVKLNP